MYGLNALLAALPKPKFFQGLAGAEVREVANAGEVRRVDERKIVLMVGDTATHLFLLLSGHANFFRLSRDGDKVLLKRLIKGDVFGLGSLLPGRMHYIGTAETTRESHFLVWPRAPIRKLAQKYPKLAENALEITLRYLAEHADRLVNLVTLTAAERLARVLCHLGRQTGKITPTGVEIEATNSDLSEMADVGPFTVSRVLSNWERTGALTKSRGKVVLHSPERLLES